MDPNMNDTTTTTTCFQQSRDVNFGGKEFILTITGLGILNIMITGGNILVVLAVASCPKLKSVNGLLITSLAVADLMVGVVVLPFSTANEAMAGLWIFGELWCQIWLAVDVWMCTASIYNLVAIAIDRYLAIVKPLAYRRLVTIPRARCIVAVVWACSFLICFPPMATQWPAALSNKMPPRCVCSPMSNSPAYILYSATGSFFLPMLIIVFVYSRLYLTARKVVRNMYTGEVQMGKNCAPLRVHTPKSSCISRLAAATPQLMAAGRQVSRRSSENLASESIFCNLSVADDLSPKEMSLLSVPSTPNSNRKPAKATLVRTRSKSLNEQRHAKNSTTVIYSEKDLLLGAANSNHVVCRDSVCANVSSDDGGSERDSLLIRIRLASTRSRRSRKRNPQIRISNADMSPAVRKKSSVPVLVRNFFHRSGLAFRRKYSSHHRLSMEIRAAKTVAVVTGCFIFCWLGFAVVYTIQAFPHCQQNPDCISKTVFSVVFWMGYLNSALNPIIYAVLNKEFRRAFKKILSCSSNRYRHSRRTENESWVSNAANNSTVGIGMHRINQWKQH